MSPNSSVSLAVRSISTPSARRIATVDEQSSPGEKLVTVATPSAIALNIAARCEIDLSPGATIVPRSLRGLTTVVNAEDSVAKFIPA